MMKEPAGALEAYRDRIRAETREECAKVAEQFVSELTNLCGRDGALEALGEDIAAAIRSLHPSPNRSDA